MPQIRPSKQYDDESVVHALFDLTWVACAAVYYIGKGAVLKILNRK